MTKRFTLLLTLMALMLGIVNTAQAQFPVPMGGSKAKGMEQAAKMTIGKVYGKVVDSQTKKPVEFASVALLKYNKDTAIAGQLTNGKGEFNMENLPFGAFRIRISFIGYKNYEAKVNVSPQNMEQDLGDLTLEVDQTALKEVVVADEKSTVKLEIDRKVFNVGKDISSRGGTGTDVMKNIPGVSVDADGNVTLRNNAPQVYVDGKPTTLTLDQIPADQIDRVEVITNPSAKFEASTTGGIINVVLKHNTKPGYNGIINAGLGTNTQYTGMGLLNLHEKKFGIMLTYAINSATNPTNGYTDRTNLSAGVPTSYYHQDLDNTFKRGFQFARVGFDYYISNRNTLSIAENFVFGKFTNNEKQNFTISDSIKNELAYGDQQNDQNTSFHNYNTTIDFKHTYPKEGKEWGLSLQYNYAKGGSDYLYTTNSFLVGGFPLGVNPGLQSNTASSKSDMYTGQWDFTDPLSKGMKLELGFRSNYKLQYSSLFVNNFDNTSQTYVRDTALSNNYRIDDLVNAAYLTFGQQVKKFSYQLGLRFEETYYAGKLLDRNTSFSYQYPSSASKLQQALFPSVALSEKFNDKHEIQLNFSRKIERPNFFQISPFIFFSDKYNYRIGNPQLQPEFINKAEFNYNMTLNKFNWLTSVYGDYSEQPITSYSYPSSTDSLVLINTFVNGENSFDYGWENTIKISAVKNLDITLNANVFYTSIKTNTSDLSLTNTGYSWMGKAIISYKFPLDINLQLNGNYEAPKIIPQGKTKPMYFFDISVSKEINKVVTINFTISDVLNSKKNGYSYDTPDYTQDLYRRRDTRYAKIGVMVKFGKMDSSILRLRKMKKDGGGQNNMQGGDGLDF